MRLDPIRYPYTVAAAALAVAAATAVLVPSASAQTFPRPAHFARAEGPTGDTAVIGDTQSFGRLLQVHGDLNGANGTIRSLGFRLDHGASAPTYTVLVEVWCSTARSTAVQPHAQFDMNHGQDKARTVALKMVRFPAAERRIPVVTGFTHVIPFDTPFVFGGQGPLCWEVVLHGTSTLVPVQFDAVAGSDASPQPLQVRVGQGCRTAGSNYAQPFRLASTPTVDWQQLTLQVGLNASAGPPSQLAALLFGLRFDAFGAAPLPFDIPGSAMAPSRLCQLHVAPGVTMATLIKNDGSLPLQLQSFVGPYMLGIDLGFQLLAQDSGANASGIVTSDAVALHFVTPYPLQPLGQVVAQGSLAGSGAAQAHTGLVTAVEY